MFHKEKNTLDLLSNFSQKNEQIKTYQNEDKYQEKSNEIIREKIVYNNIGTFSTKQKEEHFWRYFIPIVGLIIVITLFTRTI